MTDFGIMLILIMIAYFVTSHHLVATKDDTGRTVYSVEEKKEK